MVIKLKTSITIEKIFMKTINICIMTHARPEMFRRCIDAINSNLSTLTTIQKTTFNFVILCDDKSVTERQVKLDSDKLTFIDFEPSEDLSDNYRTLLEESKTLDPNGYTYFIEDDDYIFIDTLHTLFVSANSGAADNYMYNYKHGFGKDFDNNHIKNFHFLKFDKYNNTNIPVSEFVKKYDDRNFQLGMVLFSNRSIDFRSFPKDNILENDYLLFSKLKGTVLISSRKIYQQGFFNKESKNVSDSNNKESKFKSLSDYK